MPRALKLGFVMLAVGACGGGGGGNTPDAPGGGDDDAAHVDAPALGALPPVNAGVDYQLGGAYPPPAGVEVVSRDRNAAPAAGIYNICYVNGFQIQPDEEQMWMDQYPDLILRDGNGDPVIDA